MARFQKRWLYAVITMVSFAALLAFSRLDSTDYPTEKLDRVYAAYLGYFDREGEFPASVVLNDGQPQSWRIAIYPWIINDGFFGSYDLSKPFDSRSNIAVIEMQANNGHFYGECYSTDLKRFQNSKNATILRIAGSGTLGEKGIQNLDNLLDGADKTILAVNSVDATDLWTSCVDFLPEKLSNEQLEKWIKTHCRIALFANGDIRILNPSLSANEFRAMCSKASTDGDFLHKTTLVKASQIFKKR